MTVRRVRGSNPRAPRGVLLSKQLHYHSVNSPCSACGALRTVELRAGFEPATSRLRNERSGRLSYRSGMRRGCGAQGVPWVRALNRSEVQPPIEDDRAARRLAPPAGLEPTCLRLNRAAHSPGVLRGNERRETESNCWGSLPRPVFEAGSPPLGIHSPCGTPRRPRGPDRARTGGLLIDSEASTPSAPRDQVPGSRSRRASSEQPDSNRRHLLGRQWYWASVRCSRNGSSPSCRTLGSNQGPPTYQVGALTAELVRLAPADAAGSLQRRRTDREIITPRATPRRSRARRARRGRSWRRTGRRKRVGANRTARGRRGNPRGSR